MTEWSGVIPYMPYSKSNSRKLVLWGKRPALIKSAPARAFEQAAAVSLPTLDPFILGPVSLSCRLFYTSERPDLDPSLVMDVLQGKIYKNDRQVRELHCYHGIDKVNPRAEVTVRSIDILSEV